MFSAGTSRDDIAAGLDAGADDFIKNPFTTNELRARLDAGRRILEMRSSLAERALAGEASPSAPASEEADCQRLLSALDQTSEGVMITDRRGTIEYINEAFLRMSGYRREDVIGRNPRILKSGEQDEHFYNSLWGTISAGQAWRGEIVNKRADGTFYTEEMSITPVWDEVGEIARFVAIKRDISYRKGSEADLTPEQYFVRALMDNTPDAIFFKDRSGRFVRINKAMADLLGLAGPKEAIGKTDSDFFSPELAAEAARDEQQIMATGQALVSKEEQVTWPDGRSTWVSATKMPLRGPGGTIVGTFGISRDITQRKETEDAIRRSEARYRLQSSLLHAIYNVSPNGILAVDRCGNVLSHNKHFLEIWRLEDAVREGLDDDALLAAVTPRVKDPAGFRRRIEELYADPTAADHCEIELVDRRTVDRISTALEGADGEYLGRAWFFQDITQRKQEEELAQEQARLTVLRAEVGAALTGRSSLNSGLQECCEALVRWSGMAFARIWTLEPATNMLILQASAGLYTEVEGTYSRIPVGKTRIGRIAETRNPLVSHDMQSDPETADHDWAEREGMVSFAGHPLMVRNQVYGVVAVFGRTPLADATMWALSAITNQIAQFIEARRAEQALQRSEELARRLFSSIPHPAYVFDLETLEFLEVNKIALERYGYSRSEFLAMKTSDLHAKDEVERLDEYLQSNPGAEHAGQWKHCAKDGHMIDVEITYDVIDYGGRRAGLAIAQDVTERKKMEVDLRHSQKLESVGRLASGIAHEINTPIQFVGDNLRFLSDAFGDLRSLLELHQAVASEAGRGAVNSARLQELKQSEEASDLEYLNEEIPRALSQSLDGVGRVATIVKAMKEFAHPQLNQKTRANLNDALASTLVVARNELKYVAEVETDFGELPPVECNISDLNQVFLNLLVNAAQAIGEVVNGTGKRGKIRIKTRFDGEWVQIAISDTGCGIPELIRDNVFDPFFTTKDVGRGTGQGLAISRSIVVEKHGGTLTFETEVGQGTTFLIGLPVLQTEAKLIGKI